MENGKASGGSETNNANENSEPEVIVLHSHEVQPKDDNSCSSYAASKSSNPRVEGNSTLERPRSQDMEPFNSFSEISRVVSEQSKGSDNNLQMGVGNTPRVSVKQESGVGSAPEGQSSPNDVGMFLAETYESYLKDIRSDSNPFVPESNSVIAPSLPTIDFMGTSLSQTNLQSTHNQPLPALPGTPKAPLPNSGLLSSVQPIQQHSTTSGLTPPGLGSARKMTTELMQTPPASQPGTSSQFQSQTPSQIKAPKENWISERLRENIIENG